MRLERLSLALIVRTGFPLPRPILMLTVASIDSITNILYSSEYHEIVGIDKLIRSVDFFHLVGALGSRGIGVLLQRGHLFLDLVVVD